MTTAPFDDKKASYHDDDDADGDAADDAGVRVDFVDHLGEAADRPNAVIANRVFLTYFLRNFLQVVNIFTSMKILKLWSTKPKKDQLP